jgi:hypothetical protein
MKQQQPTKQPDAPEKFLRLSDLADDEYSPQEKKVLNFINSDGFQNPIQTLWSSTAGKVILVSAATILLLYATGYLFRILAYVKEGYILYVAAGNMPRNAAPKV